MSEPRRPTHNRPPVWGAFFREDVDIRSRYWAILPALALICAPCAATAQTQAAANTVDISAYIQAFAVAADTSSPAASAQEMENQMVLPDYPPGCCGLRPN